MLGYSDHKAEFLDWSAKAMWVEVSLVEQLNHFICFKEEGRARGQVPAKV